MNNAVDIAKETADIILTNKHLKSVIDGVLEGRRTFGNTMKYVMMSLSPTSATCSVFWRPYSIFRFADAAHSNFTE